MVPCLANLPPYSPDFNPIEQCFSKMKEFLRSIAARTTRKLRNALLKAINAITPSDVKGWFEHAGYWVSSGCNPLYLRFHRGGTPTMGKGVLNYPRLWGAVAKRIQCSRCKFTTTGFVRIPLVFLG